MSDEWNKYVNDPRSICKYGSRCYQKNPEHHNKYKHPPLKKNRNKKRFEPYSKPNSKRTNEVDEEKKVVHDSPTLKTEDVCSEGKQLGQENSETSSKDTDDAEAKSIKYPDKENTIPSSSTEKSILAQNLTFHEKTVDPAVYKDLFLVEMPEDFFKFVELFDKKDWKIVDILKSVNLELIGPYDLLLGKLPKFDSKEQYLTHCRYFYDPPEFQAVLKKTKSEFHIGYFRDDPNEKPVFLGSNDSAKNCVIKPIAPNIFGTVYIHLQNEKKLSPFTAIACQKIMTEIKKYADENNISLEEYNTKQRLAKVVTKTFHGAGIVVPYEKKSQLGYRHLVETDANLRKLFSNLEKASTQSEKDKILSELQPVITYASIAVDECDFGTGLEVGIALFCSGLRELEPNALSSLTTAYTLLNRSAFGDIIKAHLKNRRKGPLVSV